MKLNKSLVDALNKAISGQKNRYQLSLKVGIPHQTLKRWADFQTESINDDCFIKLLPYLREYLPVDEYASYVKSYHVVGEATSKFSIDPKSPLYHNPDRKSSLKAIPLHEDEALPVRESGVKFRAVPVISIAQAAGYEPAVEPLCDYLRETSDHTAMFFDVPDNCFALEITGDSMAPDYPNGSIALIAAGEYPQRGDIVAAKLATGQVVIKKYHRKDNVITLESINPSGANFEWHCKEERGYAQWIWPVVEITIKTRAQRWARR